MAEEEKPEPQENKTERVQLLMAPSEVEAIDDWGFSHRIRTRAEAIRRLASLGLSFEGMRDILADAIETIALAMERDEKAIDSIKAITERLKSLAEKSDNYKIDSANYHVYDLLYRAAHNTPMPYSKISDEDPRDFAVRMVQEYKLNHGSDLSDEEIRLILRQNLDKLKPPPKGNPPKEPVDSRPAGEPSPAKRLLRPRRAKPKVEPK